MHQLLIEALLEDIFSDLVKKFPTQEAQLKQAKNEGVLPKYLPWLAKVLSSGSSEPLEDIIPVIKAFHNKQPALKAKFPDEPSVVDINSYKSVADLSDKLESLVSIKYQSAPSDSDILFQDKKWIVAMPRTTAGSCELGKDTSWCTARTGSQNLFLNYVGRGKNIFLFYVIDKEGNPRSNPDAKLSIGFINGEPDFRGIKNGLTVNAAQTGITKTSFQDIVGKDNADKFISLMTSKIKSSDGKHPAQEEMDAIARDPILLKKKLDGFVNEEERIDFAKLILDSKSVSPESLRVIISFDNEELNEIIARNPNCPSEIVRELSYNADILVSQTAIINPNCPPDVLEKESDSRFSHRKEFVAKNPNCPPYILEKLSDDPNFDVLIAVADNLNCPSHVLEKLVNHKFFDLKDSVVNHPNCPPEILRELSDDPSIYIRIGIAANLNCPLDVLEKLSDKEYRDSRIFMAIASNPNCSPDILRKLSDTIFEDVEEAVAKNPNCPPEILEKLSNSRNYRIKEAVTSNPNCPVDILVRLSEYDSQSVRYNIAKHLNAPPHILVKLGNDLEPRVNKAAKANPNYPKSITESRFKAYIAAFFNI